MGYGIPKKKKKREGSESGREEGGFRPLPPIPKEKNKQTKKKEVEKSKKTGGGTAATPKTTHEKSKKTKKK